MLWRLGLYLMMFISRYSLVYIVEKSVKNNNKRNIL